MPLYEYRCRQCGHQFELIQKVSDPPPDRCEKCGSAVERLLSAPGLQFKGSGWYITDYARKEKEKETPPKKEAAASSADTTAASGAGSSSADSKGANGSGGSSPSTPSPTPKS
ncbi:MAG TPA: FmdB family zinc ribbon protein [Nitrospiria bacterium]|nr:FmdB family zinc ribbon protein [Nitrospiria bacterium]